MYFICDVHTNAVMYGYIISITLHDHCCHHEWFVLSTSDMYDASNQKLQTLILSSTVMFVSLMTIMIQPQQVYIYAYIHIYIHTCLQTNI